MEDDQNRPESEIVTLFRKEAPRAAKALKAQKAKSQYPAGLVLSSNMGLRVLSKRKKTRINLRNFFRHKGTTWY
jgi:hypothetical protein